jgi:hypothetical protein
LGHVSKYWPFAVGERQKDVTLVAEKQEGLNKNASTNEISANSSIKFEISQPKLDEQQLNIPTMSCDQTISSLNSFIFEKPLLTKLKSTNKMMQLPKFNFVSKYDLESNTSIFGAHSNEKMFGSSPANMIGTSKTILESKKSMDSPILAEIKNDKQQIPTLSYVNCVTSRSNETENLSAKNASENINPAFGIDFGSSSSTISVLQDGEFNVVMDENENSAVPNYVAFTGNRRLYGNAAKAQVIFDMNYILYVRVVSIHDAVTYRFFSYQHC